jgi:biopolymer transport protein ExbB
MVPLFACSAIALTVIIERAWSLWRLGSVADAERALELATAGRWEDAAILAAASRSPIAHVLEAGIRHRNPSPSPAMEAAAQEEVARMRKYLPVLDTIITLSPLLGLLGTVTGMISAFGVMSASGINQPHAITGGVAEALIATATGLGIAIGALVPYNYFSARLERTLGEMERFGSRLEFLLREEKP